MKVRTSMLFVSLLAFGGCSTELPIEPLPGDDEVEPTVDGGAADASRPSDGGTPARDGGAAHNCARELPTRGVASLLLDDCRTRPLKPCRTQADLDLALANVAAKCTLTDPPVDIGFTLTSDGCPAQLRYEQARIFGLYSRCLQDELETLRFGCFFECAITRFVDLR